MRCAVVGVLAAATVVLLVTAASPQAFRHELTKPPDYENKGTSRGVPGVPISPSEEEKSLLERAQAMRNSAYGLHNKAEELRDEDQYEEADALDEQADSFNARALDMERRVERERMDVKGPFKPAP